MIPAEPIGLIAGTLTTLSFAPQVLKTWNTKSARDFSWIMLLAFVFGTAFWLAYGILTNSLSVILANAATFVLVLALASMKFFFERRV